MSRMQDLWSSSHLSGGNMEYVDALYDDYCQDPKSVPEDWQMIFKEFKQTNGQDISTREVVEYFKQLAANKSHSIYVNATGEASAKQAQVTDLIYAFRAYGHLMADLNPLNQSPIPQVPCLTPDYHGLSLNDEHAYFVKDSLSKDPITLKNLYALLNKIYCRSIGIEFMHIMDDVQKNWWQERIENNQGRIDLSAEQKRVLLKDLVAADGFERYLATRFVGQKRFSLEGGDALIPMLNHMMKRAHDNHVAEVVIGMAHRGRLNVLVNVLGKAPQSLFDEFEGKTNLARTGDVKYHLGYASELDFNDENPVHAVLAFNPSHLEIIGPVVEGSVRSRLCRREDLEEKNTVIPVVIHGDSAFTGQGVVMETFNFSQARSYCTGGTVHIVINNQVGFTTSNPHDTRSSNYCTDIAKMVQAPVIHVNGDDPEAVLKVIEMAFDYRMTFKRDVVIDLVCYRRLGHNEADEASLTQPLMYQIIRARPVLRELYAQKCQKEGVIDNDWYQQAIDTYREKMDLGQSLVATLDKVPDSAYAVRWDKYRDTTWTAAAKTGVAASKLKSQMHEMCAIPDGFTVHSVVSKTLKDRISMVDGDMPINWGCAEALAFSTLLRDGYEVRLSGQDCGRGTFSHRHAVLHDQKTGSSYTPLTNFATNVKHPFTVIDSVLSEEAVLAFEYGYAASNPEALVLWEAQFGDFANGAQVVIDQFISSGEQKWGRLCGLVMLLPHGYEGQGPEHSSARLERFMQLCAQQNMQVCVPSTPAQIFHLLRRQMLRPYRKPLIIMTPKSLLRHKLAVSTMVELENGSFQNVIDDSLIIAPTKVNKVVLCSGKVYYDLFQAREERQIQDVALVRIEQLYPFPEEELSSILKQYANAKNIVWCQEEPQNQGAWFTSQHHMQACLLPSQKLRYAGREFAAAPAVGSHALHVQQFEAFIHDVYSN